MGTTTHGKQDPQDPWTIRRLQMHFVGEVQGVGFRWTARKIATDLGLSGWVRNEPDGSVSMELQGPNKFLAQYFTMFDRSYSRYPIRYVIDEKEDIPVREDDHGQFRVRF